MKSKLLKLIAVGASLALSLSIAPSANAAGDVANAPVAISTTGATEWNENGSHLVANGSELVFHRSDAGALVLRSSNDNGHTFSTPLVVRESSTSNYKFALLSNNSVLVADWSNMRYVSYVILTKTGTTWAISKPLTDLETTNQIYDIQIAAGKDGAVMIALSRSVANNVYIYAGYYSTDNGATFSAPQDIVADDSNHSVDGFNMVYTANGKLVGAYNYMEVSSENSTAEGVYYDNATSTWKPYAIPYGASMPNKLWPWVSLSPNGTSWIVNWYGLDSGSGQWWFYGAKFDAVTDTPTSTLITTSPISSWWTAAAPTGEFYILAATDTSDATLFKSTDQGATWTAGTAIHTKGTFHHINIGALVASSAGRLFAVFRMGDANWSDTLQYSFSDDKGATWTTPVVLGVETQPGYSVNATFLDANKPFVTYVAANDNTWKSAATYAITFAAKAASKPKGSLPKLATTVGVGKDIYVRADLVKSSTSVGKNKQNLVIRVGLAKSSKGICSVTKSVVKFKGGKKVYGYKVHGLKASATGCKITVSVLGSANYLKNTKTVTVKVTK